MLQSEDWSPRGFYRTMQQLYRLQEAPFYENSPLTREQFYGACEHYASERFKEFVVRVRLRPPRSAGSHSQAEALRWPDPLPGQERFTLTPEQIALGRLYFASTKKGQARSRAEVRRMAMRGPVERRRALAQARKATPQAKAWMDTRTLLLEVVTYRARRQFLWNFLRQEALADGMGHAYIRNHAGEYGTPLARAYPFLGLSAAAIAQGLKNRHQADIETAKKFALSAKNGGVAVRKLLCIFFS